MSRSFVAGFMSAGGLAIGVGGIRRDDIVWIVIGVVWIVIGIAMETYRRPVK